jgi:putative ABC transport system ATP-binding protein
MKQSSLRSLKLLQALPARRSIPNSNGYTTSFPQPAPNHRALAVSFQSQPSRTGRHFSCLHRPAGSQLQPPRAFRKSVPPFNGILSQVRPISTSKPFRDLPTPVVRETEDKTARLEKKEEDDEAEFGRTEKASQASQINLSARLSKEGASQGQSAGLGEVWRLIKIARPEVKILGVAFFLLLISSSITMSIPFSIGKILDIATAGAGEAAGADAASKNMLFGLSINTFYMALAGILATGAAFTSSTTG